MLRAFTDVRPEERAGVTGAFLTLFGILAGHTLLETARDSLFLARLAPSALPWVYLAMAVVAVAISRGPRRYARRLGASRSFGLLLVSCALVTFCFWWFEGWLSPLGLRALYV